MAAAALHGIAGIEDYWARKTMRSQEPEPGGMADRILLDVLGLGIEQAIGHLGRARPDFDGFADWVVATAGPPDPEKIARYNAWVAGLSVPEATARELAAIDAMAPVLGADDLAQWDCLGYVVLRRAIEPDEATAVEALLWRLLDARADDPSGWYGPRTNGIMIQHFQHSALEVARRSRRIHKAFAQLHGTSDLWPSTDRMGFNPPEHEGYRFPGPHLHWDMSLAAPRPLMTGGILYLTDTDANQGALQVVPGFHHRLDGWLAEIGEADPRRIDLSAEAVPIPARAGDLVIWRHELPHGASPNTADRPRMVQYVNRYSPAEIEQRVWL